MSGRKIPYPWGRLRPERRIDEIKSMVERLKRQKDVLSLQYEESLRKIEMNIEALTAQIEVAQSFAKEDEWSELRERVYALEMGGVRAMDKIQGLTISDARKVVEALEEDRPEDVNPSGIDEDFLTSSIDGIDKLFEED